MKDFEINGKIISVPNSWGDITIGKFMEIIDIQLSEDNDDPLKRDISILCVLTNEPRKTFYLAKRNDFNMLIECISFLTEDIIIDEDKKEKDTIEIDGAIYYVERNLGKNITMGEQISYQDYMRTTKMRLIDSYAPALALILKRDLNQEFNADEYISNIKYFNENVKYIDAMKLSAFFLNGQIK